MMLKLTQYVGNCDTLVGITDNSILLDRGGYTCIGSFLGDTYVNVTETIAEIEQQIKEGGIYGTN